MGLIASVFAASFLIVGLHTRAYRTLSPIDELQHFDYLVKVAHGHLVRDGERVGPTAMRAEACRGIDAPGFVPPPCSSSRLNPDDFQEIGYNTASSQSPVYYATSAVIARTLLATGVTHDLFTAGRLAGGFWLGFAVLVLLALFNEFAIPRTAQAVALALFMTAPVILHASATINTDGALVGAGGSVLLAVHRWERRSLRWWSLPVVVFVAFTLEPTTILAVGVCILYLWLRLGQSWRPGQPWPARQFRRALSVSVLLVFTMGGAYAVGAAFRHSIALHTRTAVVLPRDRQFRTNEVTAERLVSQLPALATPFNNPYLPPFLRGSIMTSFVALTGWLVFGAVMGAALLAPVGTELSALGAAGTFAMLGGGPAVVLYIHLNANFYPVPSRYGLPIIPVLMVAFASACRKRPALALCGTYATVLVGFTIVRLLRG